MPSSKGHLHSVCAHSEQKRGPQIVCITAGELTYFSGEEKSTIKIYARIVGVETRLFFSLGYLVMQTN